MFLLSLHDQMYRPLIVEKRFEIHDVDEATRSTPEHGKKFSILAEGSVSEPPVAANSRFGVAGQTRPKRCPQCGTRNSVTRGTDQRWKCKRCEFDWS